MTTAFDPINLANTRLANRIVMAPMTRSRAYGPGATPTSLMATYYAQRASAGLIISESIQPSAVGQGYLDSPGLYSAEQVKAWQHVTDAVHEQGGIIFAQLMHAGRVGHPDLLPDGLLPVGPSPVSAMGQVHTRDGKKDFIAPLELTADAIARTIDDFADAARNAIHAGFDGVELHGANGYLLHQFLSTNANQRGDHWGGSVQGRIAFTVDVVNAVTAEVGADRVGLRISPANPLNDIVEEDYRETYRALVDALAPAGLAYLHVMEITDRELTADLRARFGGTFILNPATPDGVTDAGALGLVADGTADLVSFGALFLANPDLPARLATAGPFNAPHRATYYGGDERGYTDYPSLNV